MISVKKQLIEHPNIYKNYFGSNYERFDGLLCGIINTLEFHKKKAEGKLKDPFTFQTNYLLREYAEKIGDRNGIIFLFNCEWVRTGKKKSLIDNFDIKYGRSYSSSAFLMVKEKIPVVLIQKKKT
jgi:hypothetical protein